MQKTESAVYPELNWVRERVEDEHEKGIMLPLKCVGFALSVDLTDLREWCQYFAKS